MTSPHPGPFVLLATLADPAAADLCAALLRSAGIDSRLRGESLGPYRLTVGDMAATQVWVPATELPDALALIEDSGPPPASDPTMKEAREGLPGPSWPRWWPAVALGLLALLAWGLLSRLI